MILNICAFLVVGCILSLSSLGMAATPCNVRAILEREKGNLEKQGSLVRSEDGFGFRNPLSSARDLASPQPELTVRTDLEMKGLFDRVRALLIKEISGGLRPEQRSSAQQLMIARLERLDFKIRDCASARSSPGTNHLNRSLVTLCSHTKSAPSLALVALMGHELGHSLDLVNLGSSSRGVKDRSSRLEDRVSSETWVNLEKGGHTEDLRRSLEEISASRTGTFIDTAFHGDPQTAEIIRELTNLGVIETLDEGIPYEWNPAGKTYACLARGHRYPEPPQNSSEAISQRSEFSEPGAQIWGARALSLYLADPQNRPASSSTALGVLTYSQLENFKVAGGREIPSQKERDFNAIYLSEPTIQSLLNCEPEPEQNCMSHFKPSVAGIQRTEVSGGAQRVDGR